MKKKKLKYVFMVVTSYFIVYETIIVIEVKCDISKLNNSAKFAIGATYRCTSILKLNNE